MLIKDALIIKMVDHIGEHYRTNITNSLIRPALHQAPLEKQTWDLVERLTVKVDQYENLAFQLDELYQQIIAAAKFVSVLRNDVAPILRHRLSGDRDGSNRVFREMAVSNFNSNLKIFADLLNELYLSLIEIDKTHVKGRRPLYPSLPELEDVSRLLLGNQNSYEAY